MTTEVTLKIDATCPVCIDALIDPYSAECGHHVCKDHVTELPRYRMGNAQKCPICQAPGIWRADAHLWRHLRDQAKIYPCHNCDFVGTYNERDKHMNTCYITCETCSLRIPLARMQWHKTACTRKRTRCPDCGLMVTGGPAEYNIHRLSHNNATILCSFKDAIVKAIDETVAFGDDDDDHDNNVEIIAAQIIDIVTGQVTNVD